MKLYKAIGSFLKYGTLISITGLILTVLLQVFSRYFLPNSPSWTEEAARLFFVFSISFASGLALKNNSYVHLDMFYNLLSQRLKSILNLAIPSISFLLFAIMAIYSVELIVLGMAEKSPGLKIKMSFFFISMLIMNTSICFYAWHMITKSYKQLKK